jgi:4a-hydroxytetrahydrobiopterin dehydratase
MEAALQSTPTIPRPRRIPVPLLDITRIVEQLHGLEGWALDDTHLVKSYHFADAQAAMVFMRRLGSAAEARNHHPHVHWFKRDVRIELWTRKSNGLTHLDFDFAACCDSVAGGDA